MIRFLTCSSVLLAVVAQFSCVIGHAAMVHGSTGSTRGQGITVTDSVSAVQGVFGSDKNPATDWVTLEFTSARNALFSASMMLERQPADSECARFQSDARVAGVENSIFQLQNGQFPCKLFPNLRESMQHDPT